MNSAVAFVDARIAQFGVLGTNNRVPNDLKREPLPVCRQEFTKENHYRFGFDDGEFNSRRSVAADYWVEHGAPSRGHDGFLLELRRAIGEICERHGRLSVTNSGHSVSRGIIATAKEMGITLERITVKIDGTAPGYVDSEGPQRVYEISWNTFADFAARFCSVAGCIDPWVALEAYHGFLSELPHLYTNVRIRVRDHNFDRTLRRTVGPPNWCLVEYERYTAINRWLLACGRAGIPQIMLWSPELIAAQLDSDFWRNWIRDASAPPKSMSQAAWRRTLAARPGLFQLSYPDIPMAMNAGTARNSKELDEKMSQLGQTLRRANPGCNAACCIPLHRVLSLFRIEYGFGAGNAEELYGRVDAQ
jgi:hypothetical protein